MAIPAGTQAKHRYEVCRDPDCPRPYCRIYKEGFRDGRWRGYDEGEADGYAKGFEKGHQEGYDRGFPDGIAA